MGAGGGWGAGEGARGGSARGGAGWRGAGWRRTSALTCVITAPYAPNAFACSMSSSIEQHLPTTLGSVELEARLTTSCSDTSYCSACDFFAIFSRPGVFPLRRSSKPNCWTGAVRR